LAEFHRRKHVFIPYRAGAAAASAVEAASQEGGGQISATARREIEERCTHFNIPKFHLLTHFTDSIRRFGSPQNWSTDVVEMLVQPLEAGYAGTNKNDPTARVLAAMAREHALAVRALNLADLARCIVVDPAAEGEMGQVCLREIQQALMLFGDAKDKNMAA